MSLTGTALPVVLFLAAVILFAALVFGLPRLPREWQRVVQRAVAAVLLNVTVVTLAATLLNDQYAFYVSWSDLLGVRSAVTTAKGGGTAQQAASASVQGVGLRKDHTPATLPPLPFPGSRLQTYTVTGPRSGISTKVMVYLPEGYDPKQRRTYPVILALHGFPGHPQSLFAGVHFDRQVDAAVAMHKLAAPIVVVPEINSPADVDTECVNAPGGLQTETWLAADIPQWVVSHFRVQTARTSWATFGYSFGGWCSAMLGIKHPDIFGGSIVMQGYFRPDFDVSYEPFKPGSAAWNGYDLVKLARQRPPALALWVLASKQDGLSYPSTAALVKYARRPLSITAVLLKTGGHRGSVWVPRTPEALDWLGRSLPGFQSTARATQPRLGGSGTKKETLRR
ncbi:esterase family protein [Calidifontibacter sp. DB0510]|uniref:Esterase family protein n=1 Tax=Metallococcus carri TaxID=1656884 RepID=A0A967B101_9MICO|nr:alpha/beta hydrolase-fold protein [Metallococcus carri]NHN56804.1 esterase family protein [Metallococcus carri]NOP37819.1 hypothetical protein [Calidifontibacter sp. DB2511S]